MLRSDQLRRNPKILFWGKCLAEINALNAVITLFYLQREVSIAEIFYLSIVWSAATLLFEVPTGYLADRFGRKRTLLLGTVFLALSWAATWFAHGFPAFTVVFVLMSASFSCFSGTEEAFLYDSLQEIGQERDMTKHNGRLQSAHHLFNIFLPAAGAWIARDLSEAQFFVLLIINLLAAISALGFFFFLAEPKHAQSVVAYEKGIFRESLETIKREPFLLRAAMNQIIIFIASLVTWRAYQPFLTAQGVSVFWLGVFYALMHGIIFLLHQRIGVIEKYLGTVRVLSGSIVLMIAALAGIFITAEPWLLFVFILIALTLESARAPVFGHAMNRLINSRSRATTLSNLNVFRAVLGIPIVFLSGWGANINIEYIFLIAIGLCLSVLFLFPIRQRDLVPVARVGEPAPDLRN